VSPEGHTIRYLKIASIATLAFAPYLCFGQQIALNSAPTAPRALPSAASSSVEPATAASLPDSVSDADGDVAAPSEASVAPVKVAAPAPQKSLTGRWLDLTEMSESQRYRNEFDQNGEKIFDSGQQRTALSGHIKLDRDGRYFIGIRAESGQFFNWGYADYIGHDFLYYAGQTLNGFTPAEYASFFSALEADPAGSSQNFADKGWNFYVRDLYVSATPIKQVTVEFGSIQIERGYSSEITTFDDDGFIAGERVRIHDAKHFGLDEVSFTSAYLGDVVTPNFFKRGDRLKQSNYRQVAGKKLINQHIAASAEYNWLNGTDTLREGAVFKVAESKAVDEVHVELYQRLNTITFPGVASSPVGPVAALPISGAEGFAVFVTKKVRSVSGDFGYDRIDSHYGVYENSRLLEDVGFSLNGDSYSTGNRIFGHMNVKINPVVTLFGFYTHELSGDAYTYNKQGFNAGLKFDLKAMANAEKKIF
jgi:hypothetical protein